MVESYQRVSVRSSQHRCQQNLGKHRTGDREAAAVGHIRDIGSGGISEKEIYFRDVYKAN